MPSEDAVPLPRSPSRSWNLPRGRQLAAQKVEITVSRRSLGAATVARDIGALLVQTPLTAFPLGRQMRTG